MEIVLNKYVLNLLTLISDLFVLLLLLLSFVSFWFMNR